MITMALPKGRLGNESVEIIKQSIKGLEGLDANARKLLFESKEAGMRFILVKPSDVPIYVEYGAADLGIVGKDILLEEGRALYEMMDLGFGRCRMAVAGFPDKADSRVTSSHTRVATNYPNIARNHFSQKGKDIEIIKLNGSVELGPIIDLSDLIVDIVESGQTLKENGLVIIEEICEVSARLVVNRASLKTKNRPIVELMNAIGRTIEKL